MNRYIVKLYDLDDELLTTYTLKTAEDLSYVDIRRITLNRFNKEFDNDFTLQDVLFQITDLNEEYNVIDLTKEN